MRHAEKLMGNAFLFCTDHANSILAEKAIAAAVDEVRRIETIFTTFNDNSEVQKINLNAGIQPVKVSLEVIDLIERSQKISRITQGAFDLTYGSLDKAFWNFDQQMTVLPHPLNAAAAVRNIDYTRIEINRENNTVYLPEDVRIGFGGIGKGYAADRASKLMQELGVQRGFVSASGDIFCWGDTDKPWNIALEMHEQVSKLLGEFYLNNYAVATSGDYEKFVEIDGQRYSHTIDPKTGYPAKSMKSVTVIAPFAELADALCTPLMIMGPEVGLHTINQLEGIEAIILDQNNELHTSANIQLSQHEKAN